MKRLRGSIDGPEPLFGGIVLAAPGSEPVAEPQEFRLVDRREDRNHCRLDDFVFQSSNAERPLFAIRLGYVFATRWQCSIRS